MKFMDDSMETDVFSRDDMTKSGACNRKITSIVLNNFKNDSRVIKTCRSLLAQGFRTRVVALHDTDLPEFETMEGFEVHRVKLTTSNWPRNKIIQALKYLEFSWRVLFRYNDYDVYHCNDLHTLPVGAMLKLFSRRPVKIVYDAHEYETETDDVGEFERSIRRILEKMLIRFVDGMITVSDSIANEYVRLYGVEKPTLILNIPSYSEAQKTDYLRRNLNIPGDRKIFLYQGGLARGRGINVLLDAFDDPKLDHAVIVFMGYGPLEDEIKSRAKSSEQIYFHDAVPPGEVHLYTASADVGISTIENTCLSYYYCLPNKLFEYAMAEIPVIVSNLYEMEKIVKAYEIGVVAPDNTVDGIRQALREIESLDMEKFKSKVAEFKREFNWEAQEPALVKLYAGL